METTRPPGFPGNPPARMPRAPTPARSPPPRPLRRGEMTFRPTHDVGPRTQCISGLNYAAYGLPVNASRPGSPQAHASLGSGWRPTLAGWDWIPTGFRTRFRRSHHVILSPLTGLSRHTHCITVLKKTSTGCGNVKISRSWRDFQVPMGTGPWFPRGRYFHSPRHVLTHRRERLDLKGAITVLRPATAVPARRAVPAGTALPPDGSDIGATS